MSNGNVANLRPFEKGQSGNPAGRPKVAEEMRLKLRQWITATDGGFDKLIAIANNENNKEQAKVLMFIFDHAYGKAVTQIAAPEGDDFDKLKIVIQRDDRVVASKDNGNSVGLENAVANAVLTAAKEENDDDEDN